MVFSAEYLSATYTFHLKQLLKTNMNSVSFTFVYSYKYLQTYIYKNDTTGSMELHSNLAAATHKQLKEKRMNTS